MKIAVIQIARLGDIYQTWPALRAYKQAHPESEITLIVRQKFSEAVYGLDAVNEVIELPIKHILEPLISDIANTEESENRMTVWLNDLVQKGFDQIINLSFSPLSSWISYYLSSHSPSLSNICGYSRTSDGFLSIPDDMSAYFYAQVGTDRPNRFHLAEIFGTLMGVDVQPKHWETHHFIDYHLEGIESPFIALQVGASNDQKTLSASALSFLLSNLGNLIKIPIVLLGHKSELAKAETILSSTTHPKIFNLVGKTALTQVFSIIKQSSLLVCPDSSLTHIASLTQTRTLQLSHSNFVNFWETGPRAPGSFVFIINDNQIQFSEIANTIFELLTDKNISASGFYTTTGTPSYLPNHTELNNTRWELIQSMYQGGVMPTQFDSQFLTALNQLRDVNEFMIELLNKVKAGSPLEDVAQFINRSEEIVQALYRVNSDIRPIIDWYLTEKLRIGPGSHEDILEATLKVQFLLSDLILHIFNQTENLNTANARENNQNETA